MVDLSLSGMPVTDILSVLESTVTEYDVVFLSNDGINVPVLNLISVKLLLVSLSVLSDFLRITLTVYVLTLPSSAVTLITTLLSPTLSFISSPDF